VKKLGIALTTALLLLPAARARADVPADYLGTPFGGTPRPLPGRIDFEDFDEGGENIAWDVDDHTGNFGEGGCAANGYREGIHPQLCQTNTNPGENDLYTVGPMTGSHYPSDAMPQSIYIGYTHDVDWVKLTVNVTQAGTYRVSSSFASEGGGDEGIKLQVGFNGVIKVDSTLPGTGGYHNWADYVDFAEVELEAGEQVLQFFAKSMHINYDYLQFSLVLPGGGVDDGSGTAGTGGTGGSGGGGGGGGTAGTDAGSGGMAGTAGEPPVAMGGSVGTAGAPASGGTTAASAGSAGSGPAAAAPATNDEAGGCTCTAAGAERPALWAAPLLLLGLAFGLRRRGRS
jgi:MYXO-CTERM domain-containing protein